jgi:hypothetical protein
MYLSQLVQRGKKEMRDERTAMVMEEAQLVVEFPE